MAPEFVALVPVKANSERVPGKNMRLFAGLPLLHRVLATLELVPEVARVCVNTDSAEAASYARQFPKVITHARPWELRGDAVPMNRIIEDDLSRVAGEFFLQTHATNPLLRPETVSRAIGAFLELTEEDALFSVLAHKSRFYDHARRALNHDPRQLVNTQELAPIFEENSCLYIFSRAAFYAGGKNRLGSRPAIFPMSRIESQDIDTEEDFLLAELLWRSLALKK